MISLVALVTVAALLIGGALAFAGRWLSAADAPQQADAIIVLGGAFERTLYAAELYASGYAERIYLSTPQRENSHRLLDGLGIHIPDENEISMAILRRKGIPPGHVVEFPRRVLSTVEEATTLRQLFGGSQSTLLVVTSAYHVRRARMIIGDALAGGATRVIVVATPHERYAVDWWKDQDSARQTILELAKIAYYLAGGRFTRSQRDQPMAPAQSPATGNSPTIS